MRRLPATTLAAAALAGVTLPALALGGLGPPPEFDVRVTVVGSPPAAVVVEGASVFLNAPAQITLVEEDGTTLRFRAVGEDFRGWRGACTGVTEICTFMVTGNTILNAYFGQDPPAPDAPVVVPPVTPPSGGSGASGGSSSGGGSTGGAAAAPLAPAPRGTPRLGAARTRVKGTSATSTGRLPNTARAVVQRLVLKGSVGVQAVSKCTVRRSEGTYRCEAKLFRGTWVATTRATRGKAVVAQSQATVRVP